MFSTFMLDILHFVVGFIPMSFNFFLRFLRQIAIQLGFLSCVVDVDVVVSRFSEKLVV